MITEEKIKAIRKKIRAGFPEGEMREQLMKEGYSNEDIVKVFAPHYYDMRSWYMFFGIIFSLVGIWLFLNSGNLLLLVLSALIFWQYYREGNRLQKNKTSD
ncbi:hypothetical protein [Pollutibacter soli]|uniref:hypothetical protein n=1 Tax=Pollutibacter soli TaxID=3034157 RepID=UPI003014003A